MADTDWDKIIELLANEKWAAAEKLSLNYLNQFDEKADSLAAPAILRYMYIRCIGAQLGEKEYSKEEAELKLRGFVGKTVLTPPKTFHQKCIFNCFQLSEDKDHFYSCSSNKAMTVIHIFETYIMNKPEILQHTDELEGENLRLGAIIKEIKTGGFTMPRLEITFQDAFIWDGD